MFYVKLALVLLVVLLGLAFHLRNEQLVVVDFYLGSFEMPLSLALAVTLLAGACLGVLAGLPKWLALKRDKAKLSRQLKKLQPDEQNQSADDAD
ncbi:MAG: LapA family protein [Gammaproteobacteria bacterium]|nr:LapA family protein [Gammaproteobacteria bacterium]MDE0286428.1 LapA family protein [Gammaproteobacteria bacterium]MDE0514372.1 LapA family protein [Gammaproteobacteria bacterium]